MRAKAKRQVKSFKDVLPVGTVLYRFAKSPNMRLVREYIVDAEASDNIKNGFDAEYTTNKNNYCHYTHIGSIYFCLLLMLSDTLPKKITSMCE